MTHHRFPPPVEARGLLPLLSRLDASLEACPRLTFICARLTASPWRIAAWGLLLVFLLPAPSLLSDDAGAIGGLQAAPTDAYHTDNLLRWGISNGMTLDADRDRNITVGTGAQFHLWVNPPDNISPTVNAGPTALSDSVLQNRMACLSAVSDGREEHTGGGCDAITVNTARQAIPQNNASMLEINMTQDVPTTHFHLNLFNTASSSVIPAGGTSSIWLEWFDDGVLVEARESLWACGNSNNDDFDFDWNFSRIQWDGFRASWNWTNCTFTGTDTVTLSVHNLAMYSIGDKDDAATYFNPWLEMAEYMASRGTFTNDGASSGTRVNLSNAPDVQKTQRIAPGTNIVFSGGACPSLGCLVGIGESEPYLPPGFADWTFSTCAFGVTTEWLGSALEDDVWLQVWEMENSCSSSVNIEWTGDVPRDRRTSILTLTNVTNGNFFGNALFVPGNNFSRTDSNSKPTQVSCRGGSSVCAGGNSPGAALEDRVYAYAYPLGSGATKTTPFTTAFQSGDALNGTQPVNMDLRNINPATSPGLDSTGDGPFNIALTTPSTPGAFGYFGNAWMLGLEIQVDEADTQGLTLEDRWCPENATVDGGTVSWHVQRFGVFGPIARVGCFLLVHDDARAAQHEPNADGDLPVFVHRVGTSHEISFDFPSDVAALDLPVRSIDAFRNSTLDPGGDFFGLGGGAERVNCGITLFLCSGYLDTGGQEIPNLGLNITVNLKSLDNTTGTPVNLSSVVVQDTISGQIRTTNATGDANMTLSTDAARFIWSKTSFRTTYVNLTNINVGTVNLTVELTQNPDHINTFTCTFVGNDTVECLVRVGPPAPGDDVVGCDEFNVGQNQCTDVVYQRLYEFRCAINGLTSDFIPGAAEGVNEVSTTAPQSGTLCTQIPQPRLNGTRESVLAITSSFFGFRTIAETVQGITADTVIIRPVMIQGTGDAANVTIFLSNTTEAGSVEGQPRTVTTIVLTDADPAGVAPGQTVVPFEVTIQQFCFGTFGNTDAGKMLCGFMLFIIFTFIVIAAIFMATRQAPSAGTVPFAALVPFLLVAYIGLWPLPVVIFIIVVSLMFGAVMVRRSMG